MSLDKFIERELEATGYWKNYPDRFKEITMDPPTWKKVITAVKELKGMLWWITIQKDLPEDLKGDCKYLLERWDKEFSKQTD